MSSQLAWIGLGNMGRGMATNITEKAKLDKPLILFNRTHQRAADLSSKVGAGKAVASADLDDTIAKSEIIFTSLGNDADVEDLLSKVLKNNVKGKLIVECSTIHPDTTKKLSDQVVSHGAQFVACPVFGAPAMADAGQLVCVLAGPPEAVDKVKPYTKGVMGRADIDLSGHPPGKATLLKLVGNTFILNMVESLAEGHTVAEKSGLGTDVLHQFVENLFPGPYTKYSERLLSGDYHKREQPLFAASLARKDARHALDLAHKSGARMLDIEVADKHLSEVEKERGAQGDITGIYGVVRQEAGLKFEN